jgi:hypothetical protein
MERKFTDEELVLAWRTARSHLDVEQKLGVTQTTVCRRAARLLKAGVKLPAFRSSRNREVDVEGLNALLGDKPEER